MEDGFEGITRVLSWPVHFGHRTPLFGQNDQEKACVECEVCTFMCPGSEFSFPPSPIPSLPKQYYIHPSFQSTHAESVYLTPDSLYIYERPIYTLTHTYIHTRVPRKLPVPLVHTLSLSLFLSLSLRYTHTQVLGRDGQNGRVVG